MRFRPVILVLTVGMLFSVAAEAIPISPLDPKVGVRGRDSGSPSIFDGSFFALEPCEAPLLGLFCAPYNTDTGDGAATISTLVLRFADVNGLLIPNTVGGDPEGPPNFVVDPLFSDFPFLELLENGFDIELSGSPLNCAEDGGEEYYDYEPEFEACLDLRIFSDTDGFVSVRSVENVANLNLTETVIPEPATLFLLSSGLALLGSRYRRTKNRR